MQITQSLSQKSFLANSAPAFRALSISQLRTLSWSVTSWTHCKDPISAACTWDSILL